MGKTKFIRNTELFHDLTCNLHAIDHDLTYTLHMINKD